MASIFIRTVFIYLFLSIAIKIMGKRQIGELEISELVSTLVLSEVAALPIADPDIPLMNAVIPIISIVCLEIIISSLKNKHDTLKKYIEGEPTYLVYKGVLNQEALLKNRISINELLSEMRAQGSYDIRGVDYAILEQNGKLSVFENQEVKSFAHPLIIDRSIDKNSLQLLGYDENWLNNVLKKNKITSEEIFLMTVDEDGYINIIRKDS